MRPINIDVILSKLICLDEADGAGNAEPYMWTFLFKLDGSTCKIVLDGNFPGLRPLKGDKVVFSDFSIGSHGNLLNTNVDAGNIIDIPPAVGFFKNSLESIKFKLTAYKDILEKKGVDPKDIQDLDIGGRLILFYILLEEDAVSDSATEAAHRAINKYVDEKINSYIKDINFFDIISELNEKNAKLPLEEKISFKDGLINLFQEKINFLIGEMKQNGVEIVKDAIVSNENIANLFIDLFDRDDLIGTRTHFFLQDRFINLKALEFTDNFPEPSIDGATGSKEGPLDNNPTDDGRWKVLGMVIPTKLRRLIKINEIPISKELVITNVQHRSVGFGVQNSFIDLISGIDNGKPWILNTYIAISLIKKGEKVFYTSNKDGKLTLVIIINPPLPHHFEYLSTVPNETEEDNLSNLPSIKNFTFEPED